MYARLQSWRADDGEFTTVPFIGELFVRQAQAPSNPPQDQLVSDENLETAARKLGQLTPIQRELVARVLQFEESQWQLLETMMSLPSEQLDLLEYYLNEEGGARISADGRVSAPLDAIDGVPGDVVIAASIKDLVVEVRSIVRRVRDDVGETKGRIPANLKDRLPDRPDVRELVDDIEVPRLREFISVVTSELEGVLAFLQELRSEYNDFVGPDKDCGPTTACAMFKDDIKGVFADVKTIFGRVQRLRCLNNPDARIGVDFETDLIGKLIDKAPNLPLYTMWLVMRPPSEGGLAQFEGWPNVLSEVVDALPAALDSLCSETLATSMVGQTGFRKSVVLGAGFNNECPIVAAPGIANCGSRDHEELVCFMLRRQVYKQQLRFSKAVLDKTALLYAYLLPYIPGEVVATAGATVAAGAAAGTKVDNKAKHILENIKLTLERLESVVDRLIARRAACGAAEASIESDLRSCSPPRSIFLAAFGSEPDEILPPSPTLREIARVMEYWICEAERSGLDATRVDNATTFLQQACEKDHTIPQEAGEAYALLCEAYDELIPFDPTQVLQKLRPWGHSTAARVIRR